MSSMFKKKGGLAFKPKAPQLRRPGAPGAPGAPPASAPATTPQAATKLSEATEAVTAATFTAPPAPVRDASPVAPAPAPAPTPLSTAPGESEKTTTASIQRHTMTARTRRPSHVVENGPTQQIGDSSSLAAPALPPTPSPTQARTQRTTTSQQEADPSLASSAAGAALTVQECATVQPDSKSILSSAVGAAPSPQDIPIPSSTAVSEVTFSEVRDRYATARRDRPAAAGNATSVTETVPPQTGTAASVDVVSTIEASPFSAVTDGPPKKRKYTRRKPVGDASLAEGSQEGTATVRKPRATAGIRKQAATSAALQEGVSTPGTESEGTSTGTPAGTPTPSAPKRARKERSVTPEDAETRTVDHRELKMEDLTKDLRIGKKFSRHDELVDRLREKRRQYRKERLQNKKNQAESGAAGGPILTTNNSSRAGSVLDGELGDSSVGAAGSRLSGGINVVDAASAAASVLAAASVAAKAKSSASSSGATAGPQFEIIDGTIVVNQASLVHDRHAAAAAEAGELEEVEENDFTRQTTSNTYLKPGKLRGPNAWTDEETELFYRALSMFGTSFDLICKWFPGKSRRHIKMKFNREDKLRPDRITQALVGQHKVAIDVDEYMARTGVTLHATETIDAEYALRQAEHDAEQQRIVDEQAEDLRKKREALFGPRNGGTASAGGNSGEDNNDSSGQGNGSGSGGDGEGDGGGSNGAATLKDDEIDETDLMERGGRGKRGHGGRGAGRYGGRNGAGVARASAGGFGV